MLHESVALSMVNIERGWCPAHAGRSKAKRASSDISKHDFHSLSKDGY
jgi:hypothetical protein